MSELVVVTYPDLYRAGEVCAALQRMHEKFHIEVEDIAYVTREENGKLKLHETVSMVPVTAGLGMVRGTIWGGLIGLLFFNPLLGMVAGSALGAAAGAATGRLIDYGISESLMKEIGTKVVPGSSALFVLFREANWEQLLDRIAEFGGTVMHSTLSEEAEAKLQTAIEQGGTPKAA